MTVMRTTKKAQRQPEVGWVSGQVLLLTVFLWIPQRVTGDCGESAFNLSAFSPININLVSQSWIDAGGSIRMAPPDRTNTTDPGGTSLIEGQSAMSMGQAMYRTPVALVDPRTSNPLSFSIFFSFALISAIQVPPVSNGIAVLLTQEQNEVVGASEVFSPGNAVWWNTSSHSFAVQLEKWDQISSRGIDNNESNAIYVQPSAVYRTYLEDAATNFAWIDYDATKLHLQVSVSNISDGPKWPVLSTSCNLSEVFLNPMFVGFYSRDKVSINRWSFVSNGCPPPLPPSNTSQNPPFVPPSRNFPTGPRNVTDSNRPAVPAKHSWITRNRQLLIYIGAGGVCGILFCLLAAVVARSIWLVAKYRGAKAIPDRDTPFTPQIFTYRTLSMATNAFDERALLGRGGFGSVYKGIIAEDESSTLVAVKRIESRNDAQRERQFIAEVSSIGRLRHRSLVQLLGWCHEKGELLLVYEYMPNGSLDRLLFGTQETVLPWDSRYNIVSGVAEALAFLHGEWEKQVVHRDVKASNVLLDSNFNPRLGDFGLARLGEHNRNPKSTSIAGTLGYLAPEITITGKATDKTDVFSFGALALEVACGRRPIERSLPAHEVVLVDWVWDLHSKGEMMSALDSSLPRGRLALDKVATLLNVGLLCSHPDPAARPSMRQVVRMLSGEVNCPPVPDSKPIPPFAAYRRPLDHNSPSAARGVAPSSKPGGTNNNKASSRTQSRVSDCGSI